MAGTSAECLFQKRRRRPKPFNCRLLPKYAYTPTGQIRSSCAWAFLIMRNGSCSVLWRSRKLSLDSAQHAGEGTQGRHRTDFYSSLGSSFLIVTALVRTFFIARNLRFILREMGFITRIPREGNFRPIKDPPPTLLLAQRFMLFAQRLCFGVSFCSFVQFSYFCLISLFLFNF